VLSVLHTFAKAGPFVLTSAQATTLFLKRAGKTVPKKNYELRRAVMRMLSQQAETAGMQQGPYLLKMLAEMVQPELLGEFQAALINWFAVVHTCLETVMLVNKGVLYALLGHPQLEAKRC
jgi:hypothetical protein